MERTVSKAADSKKLRVYEVAKDLGMSSEAVLQIVRRLGVEVKNHMSTLLPEAVAKVQAEMAHEKSAVREEQARKHEQELQRAREERARAAGEAGEATDTGPGGGADSASSPATAQDATPAAPLEASTDGEDRV